MLLAIEDPSIYYPIDRWSDAIGMFHSFQSISITNMNAAWFGSNMRSGIAGSFFSISSWLWKAASYLLDKAINLDIFTSAALKADMVGAKLAQAVVGNSAVTSILMLVIVGFIFHTVIKSRRNGIRGVIQKVVPRLIAIVMLVLMCAAPASGMQAEKYTPKFGAPSWYASKIVGFTNTVVSPIVTGSGLLSDVVNDVSSKASEEDGLHCQHYIKQLHKDYMRTNSEGARDKLPKDTKIPLILAGMWENSTLNSWRIVQLGDNEYADASYCHLLDILADDVSPENARAVTSRAASNVNNKYQSLAVWDSAADTDSDKMMNPFTRRSSKTTTEVMAGWGAYRLTPEGSFVLREGVPEAAIEGGGKEADKFGKKWWSDKASSYDSGVHRDEMRAGGSKYGSFLSIMEGENTGGAVGGALIALLASGAICFVFLALSVAVILAKFGLIVSTMLLAFTVLASLLPGQDTWGRISKNFTSMIGYAIFSLAATVLVAVVAVLVQTLNDIGGMFFADSSVLAIFWAGLAPVITIYSLHTAFKKMGIPSPFTLQGAIKWGKSGGENMARNVANSSAVSRASGWLKNKTRGKVFNRSTGLTPVGNKGLNKGGQKNSSNAPIGRSKGRGNPDPNTLGKYRWARQQGQSRTNALKYGMKNMSFPSRPAPLRYIKRHPLQSAAKIAAFGATAGVVGITGAGLAFAGYKAYQGVKHYREGAVAGKDPQEIAVERAAKRAKKQETEARKQAEKREIEASTRRDKIRKVNREKTLASRAVNTRGRF